VTSELKVIHPYAITVGTNAPRSTPDISLVTSVQSTTGEIIADYQFAGPIIHTQLSACGSRLLVCTLSPDLSTTLLTILDSSSLRVLESRFDIVPPSVSISADSDLNRVGIATRNGIALAFEMGSSAPLCQLTDKRQFTHVASVTISGNGRWALLVQNGAQTFVQVVDLQGNTRPLRVDFQKTLEHPIVRTYGPAHFVFGTDQGEVFFVDSPDRCVTFHRVFSTRIVLIECDFSNGILAIGTLSGRLYFMHVPNGEMVIPEIVIPLASSLAPEVAVRILARARFVDSGDFLIEQFPTLRVRLHDQGSFSLENAKRYVQRFMGDTEVGRSKSLQTSESCLRRLAKSFDQLPFLASHDPDTALDLLDALEAECSLIEFYKREACLVRMEIAQQLLDPMIALPAVEYLATFDLQDLSEVYLLAYLRGLRNFDVTKCLQTLSSLNAEINDAQVGPTNASQLDLIHAFCIAGTGDFEKAAEAYQRSLSNDFYLQFETIHQNFAVGIRLEQMLVELALGAQDIFDRFSTMLDSCDSSVLASVLWVQYLESGVFPELPKRIHRINRKGEEHTLSWIELLGTDRSRDEAFQILRDTVGNRYTNYGWRPSLPISAAHVDLMELHAGSSHRKFSDQKDLLVRSENNWEIFIRSASELGIDSRSLWPFEVSYRILKKRVNINAASSDA
jgi:hypothetical protein